MRNNSRGPQTADEGQHVANPGQKRHCEGKSQADEPLARRSASAGSLRGSGALGGPSGARGNVRSSVPLRRWGLRRRSRGAHPRPADREAVPARLHRRRRFDQAALSRHRSSHTQKCLHVLHCSRCRRRMGQAERTGRYYTRVVPFSVGSDGNTHRVSFYQFSSSIAIINVWSTIRIM